MTPRRAWLLAILAILLTLAGIPAYMATMDHPLLRSTGLVAWAFMAAGLGLALYATTRTSQRGARILAGLNVLLLALWVYGFFGFARVPASSTPHIAAMAPDFTLPSSAGHDATLSTMLKDGPVLLAFYRGEW